MDTDTSKDDIENGNTSFVKVVDTDMPEDAYVEPSMLKKKSIFAIGFLLAFVTLLPNAMMSASSGFVGELGVLASFMFAAGGCYGHARGEFMWLLPALGLQLLCFALMTRA